jgi:hypothetical protein
MKKVWGILAAASALAVLFLIAGCSKDNNSSPTSSNETDQSALTTIMSDDSDLEAVNPWDGDEDIGGSPLDSSVTPIHWQRRGVWHRTSINVDIQGDTLATITRTATFNGVLHMLVDTAGANRVYIDKPMHNIVTRKAHARRVGHTRFPRDNWRVYEVTPEVLVSSDSNTVHPARVQFFTGDNGNLIQILDVTDPLNTYFSRDSLPLVPSGSQLTVVVTPSVTDIVAAYLHPHVWREGRFPRRPMDPSGDNTYSASFAVGAQLGIRMTAPDLLSHATLYTSDAPYDAGSWAIPYRVVAIAN